MAHTVQPASRPQRKPPRKLQPNRPEPLYASLCKLVSSPGFPGILFDMLTAIPIIKKGRINETNASPTARAHSRTTDGGGGGLTPQEDCVHVQGLRTRSRIACAFKDCVHVQGLRARSRIACAFKDCMRVQRLHTHSRIAYTFKDCVRVQGLRARGGCAWGLRMRYFAGAYACGDVGGLRIRGDMGGIRIRG